MQSRIIINSQNKEAQLLLVGRDAETAVDISSCLGVSFHSSQNIPDAIDAASANQFDAIAIIPDNFDEDLAGIIRNLRQATPKSKIFLLVKMWQEPFAIELAARPLNGTKLLDDYYIRPVAFAAESQVHQSIKTATPVKQPAEEHLERIKVLEKLVMEDELTGVKNRRFVREFLRQIIEHSQRQSLQATLLVFDIDNFKKYNDLYGHYVGDNILKQAAVLMQKCCRKQDVVGRIGGDEFAVVFWNLPADRSVTFDAETPKERRHLESEHPTQVINICERFIRELNKTDLPALGADGKGILAISGGLATFPRDGTTVQELFERADDALLEAKRSGKNRVYLVGSEKNKPHQV
ncbi:MAG: GGDEF domain-containing protein [Phycisphaerae bacterium]|nr:GGDEF domain-containing protein [Phycisphaerae bacterium]